MAKSLIPEYSNFIEVVSVWDDISKVQRIETDLIDQGITVEIVSNPRYSVAGSSHEEFKILVPKDSFVEAREILAERDRAIAQNHQPIIHGWAVALLVFGAIVAILISPRCLLAVKG